MNRIVFAFTLLILGLATAKAQSELPTDTLNRISSKHMKQFGGFLLDMSLMQVSPQKLPKYQFEMPDLSKDYNNLFRLPSNETYSLEQIPTYTPNLFGGIQTMGLSESLQKATFKFQNGWKLSTYGQYNATGWRMPSVSAFPWQKNNFHGGFELKSSNNTFGIRVEIHQGRTYPY